MTRVWGTEEGLPQNSVISLAQTTDGYLWAGTFNGLVRFDGVEFTAFTLGNTPELRSDRISALSAGEGGALWIGTERGVARYSEGQFQAFGPLEGIPEATIVSMAAEAKGQVWVQASNQIYRWTGGRFEAVRLPREMESAGVLFIAGDGGGSVWAGTTGGVLWYREGRLVSRILSDKRVSRVAVFGQDQVLLHVDEEGLVFWEGDESRLIWSGKAAMNVVCANWDGGIWMGGFDPTLWVLRDGRIRDLALEFELGSSTVMTLYPDKEGNMWVGLDGGGLMRLTRKRLRTYGVGEGLGTANVMSIAEDGSGNLYVSSIGSRGGISRMDLATESRFTLLDFLRGTNTVTLLGDGEGGLWLGTAARHLWRWWPSGRGELGAEVNERVFGPWQFRFEGGAWRTTGTFDFLSVLFRDSSGGLWVGSTEGGVEHWDGEKLRRYDRDWGLSDNRITAIQEGEGGAMWIGTARGLNRLDKKGSIVQFWRKDGLGVDAVQCLFVGGDGWRWVIIVQRGAVYYIIFRGGIIERRRGADFGGRLW